MYRDKPTEPLIDAETGATFVALPFLHFKDTQKFNITMNEKIICLSCHKIFTFEYKSNAHLFGEFETDNESTPIYAVHSIIVRYQSGEEIKMSGPERRAEFDDVLPIFGKMLLRFEDCSTVFVAPSFHEDYFKSSAELQTEALRYQVEWAHTYILLSRMMMKRLDLDSLTKVRAKLRLDPQPGEDEYDFENRIEKVIESFAQDDYFVWSHWAENTIDSVTTGVRDLLSPKARARNMEAFLFGDFLDPAVDVPEQETYVSPRLEALQPDLLTTEGLQ